MHLCFDIQDATPAIALDLADGWKSRELDMFDERAIMDDLLETRMRDEKSLSVDFSGFCDLRCICSIEV
jgi:hypothetical protein